MGIGTREDTELRRRHGQGAAAPEGIVEPHQSAAEERIISLVQGTDAMNLVDSALLQMVLQIAPDALAVEHDVDAERDEPVGGTNAGTVQHLGRSDRAGTENDLTLRAGLDKVVTPEEAHADGAADR